ncbi:MAG TPA: cob(I)yrinic acid a,c-diamide adenosyltransferase [Alphaproteobacteria bacterium]|nr:cob(I)yrinic acid a,c-diamide adenosyltransferase [Alphaproteobacteria bacterium]
MVKLTKIYTRGGDKGETSLGDGRRVAKDDLRVAAYGTVDEASAAIGIARAHLSGVPEDMLARVQDDLFDMGADLCVPEEGGKGEAEGNAPLRMSARQVERLEAEIDHMNASLEPLNSFILPGGTPGAAYLHLARTIARRAERLMVRLARTKGETVNPHALKYINRLSDHLFVLARHVNDEDGSDILWRPGANR